MRVAEPSSAEPSSAEPNTAEPGSVEPASGRAGSAESGAPVARSPASWPSCAARLSIPGPNDADSFAPPSMTRHRSPGRPGARTPPGRWRARSAIERQTRGPANPRPVRPARARPVGSDALAVSRETRRPTRPSSDRVPAVPGTSDAARCRPQVERWSARLGIRAARPAPNEQPGARLATPLSPSPGGASFDLPYPPRMQSRNKVRRRQRAERPRRDAGRRIRRFT